ncbi:MAG: cobalamin biosynthesis protein, partial [Dehalococcoidales bacterium]|nr:cobalamin biosynthesis protein [Dehalococcoidales bacterium]
VAPLVSHKHRDPGVVVLDDAGKFAVSLLSGHIGGANDLARRVAGLTGAEPVITTASDNLGLPSLDLLAKKSGWRVEDDGGLTHVSAALVNGEPVGVYQDAGETAWQDRGFPTLRFFSSPEELRRSGCGGGVIISDRAFDVSSFPMPLVIFRPPTLVVGIGCNRGVKSNEIEKAVDLLLARHGLAWLSVRNLATVDLKKDEPGLNDFAFARGIPVEYFSGQSLSRVNFPSSPSAAALEHVATPSVCEAAALLSSGGSLVVPKTRFNRSITLAVARVCRVPPGGRGKLYLVGIGPGSAAQMTLRAREVIAGSDAVVGYDTYIAQIGTCLLYTSPSPR